MEDEEMDDEAYQRKQKEKEDAKRASVLRKVAWGPCVCVLMCVCACLCVCARVRVRVCVCVCVRMPERVFVSKHAS